MNDAEACLVLADIHLLTLGVLVEFAGIPISDVVNMITGYVTNRYLKFEELLLRKALPMEEPARNALVDALSTSKNPFLIGWRAETLDIIRHWSAPHASLYHDGGLTVSLRPSSFYPERCHRRSCFYATPRSTCICGDPVSAYIACLKSKV